VIGFHTTAEERDRRAELVRAETRRRVLPILRGMAGQPDIDIQLRIGSVCPFSNRDDRAVWIDEIRAIEGEESHVARA
jgi:hypothetical protein